MAAGADSLGVAVLELTADPTPLNAMLASSERRTEMSMARMEAMSGKRLATVGQNMSRLGSQWTRSVSLPIVAGGAAMIKVASDFQGALTQVQTQAGASAGEIENMRKAILRLAPATGQTPVQLANALFHVESAGLRGAKALDVLTQSAKLAKIGHSDLEQTTSALVAVMKSAPKDVKNATDAIGLMNAVVGQGNMRMGDLVGALSTGIIPAAKSAGLGLRDVGAAIDVMTTRGIPAQLAATRLAMSISLMSAPTGKAAKELASVGLKGDQLATDLRKPDGLVVAVRDLKTHMDAAGLSATQQNALIAHAFGGGRSSKAILTLVQNTGDLQKAFDGIGKHSGAGVVADAWKKSQEDIGVRMDKLKAKAQTAFVDIGTKIAPEFIKVGTQVADDATKIANAFSSLPKGAQDLIITGGLTAAALGPVMRLAGVLTTFVGRTWDALKVAEGLVTGKRTLFGALKAAESAGGRLNTSVANMEVGEMIVRTMIGGPGGPGGGKGPGGAAKTAAEGAGGAEVAAGRYGALGLGRTLGVGAGLATAAGAFVGANQVPGTSGLNRLKGAVHGADPTSVLHLVGWPSVTDLLGIVGKPGPWTKYTGVPGAFDKHGRSILTAAGTPGRAAVSDQTAGAKQQAKDLQAVNQQLMFLEQHRRGVHATAAELAYLGQQAAKAGDVRWYLADRLGSEMLKSRSVSSKGVLNIITQLNGLAPGARAAASQSMTQMSQMLETAGRLPKGSTVRLVNEMLGDYRTLHDRGGTYFTGLVHDAGDELSILEHTARTSTGKARQEALKEINDLKKGVGSAFDSMASHTATRAGDMKDAIARGSQQAASTAWRNFNDLVKTVDNAMSAGVLTSGRGSQLIAKTLNATLKALGDSKAMIPIPALIASTGLGTTLPQSSALGSQSGFKVHGAAQGHLIQVGRPGEKGHDTVPMNVGGMPIMVAPGEKVAVFNDAQQHVMNRRLADYGGLPGFFSRVNRPHYMARGGFAKGGYTGYSLPLPRSMMSNPGNWSFDQGVDIPGGAGGEPEFAIGPGVITQEGIGGFGPNAPILRITAGPLAGRSIYYGHAGPDLVPVGAHVRAGQQISSVGRGIVGMSTGPHIEIGFWPPTGGANFAPVLHQLLGGAGVTGVGGVAGSAAALTKILAPHVKGKGTIANIVRAALGKAAGAANAYEAAYAPAAGVGAAGVSGSTAGLSGGLRSIVNQLAKRFGWTGQINDWLAVIQQESGGSMTAKNPSSGAYGIAQFINGPGEYAKYGGDVNTMAGQLLAMANYIKGRYGGPSAAEAHERAFNWYSRGGWVRTGATEDNFTGGPMQTGLPISYHQGNTFAQLLMGGANAGRHPNLSDLLGMGGGILPAGFPIDIRYGGRELDDVRRIDTGSGALDGSTHWTVDIESPAARRLRFPGKGDIMVRAHGGKDGKGADPHAGMHRVRYWQKGAKHKHPGRWAHKWVKDKSKSFKLPKFHAMAGFDPSDMAKIQAIDDYLNNKLSPWQGLITGIHGRVPVPPKSVADRLAEIGHLGDPPDLNTELGIDQKFLDEYFTESVLAGQAQQKFLPWLTKMLKDRKTQQDRIDDTQATIDRLTHLKARLPQERKDRDYAISTRFQLARHKLQTSSARGTFDAGQLLSDQLSGLSDEEKKARQAIPSKPPPGWSGTKAGWAAQRNRELGNVSSEFADRRAALKKAAKEHKFEGRLARSNALFGLTQEERAEKHQLSDVFSGRALAFTERLKDRKGWLARYKRLLASDETALTAATGSKDGTVVTGSGSFEDILLDKLDPMGSLAINIATKKDIDIPTLLDEINTLKGTDATTGTGAQLATLLQQQNANLEQQLAVSQDQYKVLARLPPFGGSFLSGGVVPGMLGEPRTIIAHGGETISPAGAGDVLHETHVHVTGPGLKDLIDTRVEHKTRAMSRAVKALPGARAGQLSRR